MEDTGERFTLVLALGISDTTVGPNCKSSLLEGGTGVASDRTSLGSPGMHRVSGEDGDVNPQRHIESSRNLISRNRAMITATRQLVARNRRRLDESDALEHGTSEALDDFRRRETP